MSSLGNTSEIFSVSGSIQRKISIATTERSEKLVKPNHTLAIYRDSYRVLGFRFKGKSEEASPSDLCMRSVVRIFCLQTNFGRHTFLQPLNYFKQHADQQQL